MNLFDQFRKKVIRGVFLRPKRWLICSLLFSLTLTAGLFTNVKTDFSQKVWFNKDSIPLQIFERFEEEFGNDDSLIISLHSKNGLFDEKTISKVREVTDKLWLVSGVISVHSLTNYQWSYSRDDEVIVEPFFPLDQETQISSEMVREKKAIALKETALHNFLLSKDLKTTVFYAKLKPKFEDQLPYLQAYKEVKELVDKEFSGQSQYRVDITGLVAVQAALEEILWSDFIWMTLLLIAALCVVVFWLFRSWISIFQVISLALCSTCSTLGFICWANFTIDPMSAFISAVMLSICVADIIHILSTYRQHFLKGYSVRTSLLRSMIENFKPTMMTTITTSLGFLSLASSSVKPIENFGVLVAVGAFLAWLFTYTIAIPLMLIFPDRKVRKNSAELVNFGSLTQLIFSYRKSILLIFTVLIIGGLHLSSLNIVDGDPSRYFSEDHHIRRANQFIKKEMGSYSILELVIDSKKNEGVKEPLFLEKTEAFLEEVKNFKEVTHIRSVIDIVKDVNQSLQGDEQKFWKIPEEKKQVAESLFLYGLSLPPGLELTQWASIDFRKMRASLWVSATSTHGIVDLMEKIQTLASKHQLSIEQTGKSGLMSNINSMVVETFFKSILITLTIVSLMMALLFKSWKVGLYSMVPNMTPLILGGGVMKLLGYPLDVGTAIVTSISLGIAVDDTIHFLNDYFKSQKLGLSKESAIAYCWKHSGRAIAITTLLLVLSFGCLVFSQFIPAKEMGVMIAITVFIALVSDLFLLPALLISLKSWGHSKAK